MARSKSSRRWLDEHFSDEFVKKAQAAGYRSRAAFKLIEIQEKDKLIKPGMTIVDLGAAPGGWSQLAAKWVGDKGHVFALDILEMAPLPGVDFIQGDFCEESVLNTLLNRVQTQAIDLVISDMAPNISGNKSIDQPRAMYLAELAWDLTKRILRTDGAFVVKVFQGSGFEALLKELRIAFQQVSIRKPKASRARSNEIYLVAKGYNL